MRNIKYIVIHCTAASGDQPTQDILDYWRKKGWDKNGYHWLISGNGLAVRLTDDENNSNGVASKNSNCINICYKGGWNGKDTRTPAQKEMMEVIISGYKKKYPKAVVLGHRDFSPDINNNGIVEPSEWIKLCPCFDAKTEYKNL